MSISKNIDQNRTIVRKNHLSNLVKKEKNNLISKSLYYPVRRELNNFGRLALFIVFGFLCIAVTSLYYERNKDLDFNIDKTKVRLLSALEKQENAIMNTSERIIIANKNFYQDMESRLMDTLDKRDVSYKEEIKIKNEKIENLKYQLSLLLKLNSAGREPAGKKGSTVPYTNNNMNLLMYEQKLKRNRLEELQKSQSEAFLLVNDLSNPENEVVWKNFQDEKKMELKELDLKFREERKTFRELGYRNP